MSTSTPPAGGQTPPADDPPTRQTPPTPGQTPATPSSDDDTPMSVGEAKKLRDENKQRRLSEEATKAELKKLQDAQLSEVERAQKRLAELEAKESNHQRELQELQVSRTVERLATKLSIVDPEAATRLIDWSKLEFDKETGQPTNAEAILKELIDPKRGGKTYLVGQTNPGNPATLSPTNPGSAQGQPFFTKAQLEDIDFYAAHRAEIYKARREGRVEK